FFAIPVYGSATGRAISLILVHEISIFQSNHASRKSVQKTASPDADDDLSCGSVSGSGAPHEP
ncbi:MAG: hypothetical protein OXU48_05915, partial [candidate division Zixibacteria bacterium]|nr:hypothetical protein [candidate division Zixibacteria bacterium]